MRLADTKEVTLDVRITPLSDGKYKVNIRHEEYRSQNYTYIY